MFVIIIFDLLGLLIMVSLRINSFLTGGLDEKEENKEKRGPPPTNVEWMILCYVASMLYLILKVLFCKFHK